MVSDLLSSRRDSDGVGSASSPMAGRGLDVNAILISERALLEDCTARVLSSKDRVVLFPLLSFPLNSSAVAAAAHSKPRHCQHAAALALFPFGLQLLWRNFMKNPLCSERYASF